MCCILCVKFGLFDLGSLEVVGMRNFRFGQFSNTISFLLFQLFAYNVKQQRVKRKY